MAPIIRGSDFEKHLGAHAAAKSGAFVDTNLLFAADYDLHRLHEEACDIVDLLLAQNIPIFANVTIRSELLELKRRVLITESLMDFMRQAGNAIPTALHNKLKSTRTMIDEEMKAGRHYFLSDQNIKSYRDLFEKSINAEAWTKFCSAYLKTKLQKEWQEQVEQKGLSYLNEDQKDRFSGPLNWEDAVTIIEDFGLGSSDAMIVNMFLKSNLPVLCTGDRDIAFCMSRISCTKAVVVPDSMNW